MRRKNVFGGESSAAMPPEAQPLFTAAQLQSLHAVSNVAASTCSSVTSCPGLYAPQFPKDLTSLEGRSPVLMTQACAAARQRIDRVCKLASEFPVKCPGPHICADASHLPEQDMVSLFRDKCQARLHWGKAGWPKFAACFDGAIEYPDSWCHFGCAVQVTSFSAVPPFRLLSRMSNNCQGCSAPGSSNRHAPA